MYVRMYNIIALHYTTLLCGIVLPVIPRISTLMYSTKGRREKERGREREREKERVRERKRERESKRKKERERRGRERGEGMVTM